MKDEGINLGDPGEIMLEKKKQRFGFLLFRCQRRYDVITHNFQRLERKCFCAMDIVVLHLGG